MTAAEQSDAYDWPMALRRAIKRNRRDAHNRYLQIGTVREDGSPAVRTVVFRDFQQQPERLLMVTDSRSEKVREIETNPAGEISWYFSRTREQFRLRGELVLIRGEEEIRKSMWHSMSEAARSQFYWPAPGNAPVETPPDLQADEMQYAPDTFLLLVLHIAAVDHLQLRGSPQRRWLSTQSKEGVWTAEAVNP